MWVAHPAGPYRVENEGSFLPMGAKTVHPAATEGLSLREDATFLVSFISCNLIGQESSLVANQKDKGLYNLGSAFR